MLKSQPETVRIFVFKHECGHLTVGDSELKADCFAVQQGVHEHWLDRKGLDQVCQSFDGAPETSTHPSAERRCRNLDQCYAAALAVEAKANPPTGTPAPAPVAASRRRPRNRWLQRGARPADRCRQARARSRAAGLQDDRGQGPCRQSARPQPSVAETPAAEAPRPSLRRAARPMLPFRQPRPGAYPSTTKPRRRRTRRYPLGAAPTRCASATPAATASRTSSARTPRPLPAAVAAVAHPLATPPLATPRAVPPPSSGRGVSARSPFLASWGLPLSPALSAAAPLFGARACRRLRWRLQSSYPCGTISVIILPCAPARAIPYRFIPAPPHFSDQRTNSVSLHCLHIKRVTELFVFYPHNRSQSLLSIRQFPIKKCTTG